jgi:Glycolipid 2-alpha-mannosyltransferase
MIRWWAMGAWEHPEISQLDFWCRLDSHSWVNSPIRYDMFRFMADGNFSYGYNLDGEDEGWVLEWLWRVCPSVWPLPCVRLGSFLRDQILLLVWP